MGEIENSVSAEEKSGCYTDHGVSGYGVAIRLCPEEPISGERLKQIAEDMMMVIVDKSMAAGARAIGHIKSFIRTEAGDIRADSIGQAHGSHSSGTLSHPVMDIYLTVNSIVQGIPESIVRDVTLEGIHEEAEKENLTVVKEKEHLYFDEFDTVTSEQEYARQLEAQLAAEGD